MRSKAGVTGAAEIGAQQQQVLFQIMRHLFHALVLQQPAQRFG